MNLRNKKYLHGRKGWIIAFFVALCCSVLFLMLSSNKFLFLDVLGGGVQKKNDLLTAGDVGVLFNEKNQIEVRSLKNMNSLKGMSFLLIYDPDAGTLTKDHIDSIFPYVYTHAGEGKGVLLLEINDNISSETLLFVIKNDSMNNNSFVLGDTIALFEDGESSRLRVERS